MWYFIFVLICIFLIKNILFKKYKSNFWANLCMPLGYPYVFFGEMSVWVFSPYSWLGLFGSFWYWVLHILDITTCRCIICKYFLPLLQLSFHFLMVSFSVQELLSWIRLDLFIFTFIYFALGDIRRKYYCDLYPRMVCF